MTQPSPPGGGNIGGNLNASGLAGTNAVQMNALRAALAQQLANQPGAANSNVVATAGFLNNSALKGFDDIKKSLNSQKSDLDKMLRAAELGGWTDQEKKNIKDQLDSLRDVAKGLSIAASEVIKDNRASGNASPKLIGAAFDMQNYGNKFGNTSLSGNAGRPSGPPPVLTNPAMDAGLARIQDIIDRVTRYQAGVVNGVNSGVKKGDLKQDSGTIREEFRRIMADTTITDTDKADYAKNSSAAQNKITSALKQQNDAMKNFTNLIVGAITTFGVGSAIQKFAINDPYQYGFKPAMSVMGTTGVMGQAMSSAMSAQKGFQVERDQTGMQMGMGLMATGGLTSKLLGGALMAGGALGIDSKIYDSIAGNLGGVNSQKVYERSLATQFMKPDQFIASGEARRSAAMAIGGSVEGGNGSFGAYYNDAARQSKTGSAMGDRMLAQGYMGLNLNSVGMSADEGLKLAGNIGTNVNGLDESRLRSLTSYAAINSKLTGTSAESMVGSFNTIQGMGINNIQQTMDRTEGAVSKNGVLDSFASNVLVPGLLKVSQSLALKNVGQSAEKLNDGVLQLYRGISASGTNFGKLVTSNPDMIGQILGSFSDRIKDYSVNVQQNYRLRSAGLNPNEFSLGAGSTKEGLEKVLKALYIDKQDIKLSDYQAGTDFLKDSGKAFQIQQSAINDNLPFQAVQSLMKIMLENGGKLGTDDYKKLNLGKNATELSSDLATKASQSLAEQAQAMVSTVSGMADKIKESQDVMKNFITSGALSAAAKNGIDAILDEMKTAIRQVSVNNPGSNTNNARQALTTSTLDANATGAAKAFNIPSSAVASANVSNAVNATASYVFDTQSDKTFSANSLRNNIKKDKNGKPMYKPDGSPISESMRDDLDYIATGKASIEFSSNVFGRLGSRDTALAALNKQFDETTTDRNSDAYATFAKKYKGYDAFQQNASRAAKAKEATLDANRVTQIPVDKTGTPGANKIPLVNLLDSASFTLPFGMQGGSPGRTSVNQGVATLLDPSNDSNLAQEVRTQAALIGPALTAQATKVIQQPDFIKSIQNNYRDKIAAEANPAKKKMLEGEAEEFRKLGARYELMRKYASTPAQKSAADSILQLMGQSTAAGNGILKADAVYNKNGNVYSPVSGALLNQTDADAMNSKGVIVNPTPPPVTKPVIKPKPQPNSVINTGNGDFIVHIRGNNMETVKQAIHDSLNKQAIKSVTAHKPSPLV